MINALAGARFLETGVCRTTRVPCVLGAEDPGRLGVKCEWKKANMRSDDGVSLCVVDLPGICDAENTGTESNFTDLTMQWAAHCDVIVWVTDVRTCFLTSHEKQEYEKLKDALERVATNTGRLFQFCVVLAKCDVDIVGAGAAARSVIGAAKRVVAGEIVSAHEETTVADCFDRAKRMFPIDRIVPFNAFGRILTRESSDALRALARQLAPNSTKVNTELNMQWATADLHEKRQAQMFRSIVAALTGGAGNTTAGANKLGDPAGLPAGWTTLLDIPTNRQYYINESTGQRQWQRPMLPGDVSSSSAKLNRELVDGLDESTTAMLMLLVLGVDDLKKAGTWHPIVAAAGQSAKGLVTKHAEVIGLLKHGPSAAQKHEATIKRRVELKYDQDKSVSALVEAMMHMCGANCIVTARMYFKLPFLGPTTQNGVVANTGILTPPSAMKAVPTGAYPAMLALDVEHNENRALGMSVSWVAKVKEARARLWGDAERDVCVTTVLALVREKLLHSVLAPPIGI